VTKRSLIPEFFLIFFCRRAQPCLTQENQEFWAGTADNTTDAVFGHIQLDGDIRHRHALTSAHEKHPALEVRQARSQLLNDGKHFV
jgi:hypothetical protein